MSTIATPHSQKPAPPEPQLTGSSEPTERVENGLRAHPGSLTVTVHEPRRGALASLRAGPLRWHVEMAGHFGHNYVKKYYMGTHLGLLWLPLVPLMDIFLRSLLFGGFLGVPSGGVPYLLFLVVASIGWYFFERTTYWGYRALQYNHRYFRSIPVPWLPAVTGTVVPGLVIVALYSAIALGIAVYYLIAEGHFYLKFGVQNLYALLGLIMLLLYAWTLALFLAPLVRVVRDARLFIRFPLNLLYIITPVLYTIQAMPAKYRVIATYNPLTAPIAFMRHGLLGMPLPGTASILTTLIVFVIALPIGLMVFTRAERASHVRL